MQNSIEDNRVHDDEIDLRELFLILKKRKKIIYTIVTIATLVAVVLAYYIKKPIYSVKSMIEIGSITSNSGNNSDFYTQDIIQKISYKYKVGAKGVTKELPYIDKITSPKNSKKIITLEVLSRNNEEGTKYLQTITDEIVSDTNKKIYAYIEEIKKQIKLSKNDLLSSEENYKNIKNSIDDMNQRVTSLSRIDPALAAIYALQVSQKDSILNGIKNTILQIKKNIEKLKESISTNKIEFTKMIGKIQTLDHPIKPRKKLIIVVTFITSLIFSIFLVFFLNFIEGLKKEDE
ncbi:chain length determinant protein [hydrothermal vent metagenome]|uniref:Chain length determinant protein n=1 Tax=hydrothermal vent metagenome TaxID=652676 RepID=A0A1W1CCM5_9ZZZZ